MTVGVFVYELLDDFMFLAFGAVVYSYTRQWFGARRPRDRRTRDVVNGLAFGALAILLMLQGISAAEGILVDARNVPVALIALFDGWPAGLLAAGVAAGFRLLLGGAGSVGGAVALLATGVAGGLAHAWARRDGHIGPRHVLGLSAVVFLIVCGRFLAVGALGLAVLRQVGPSYVLLIVGGIALLGRLFHDVLERERATELRAIALLANAAAHEINNPLAILMGALELLQPKLAGSPEARLVTRALEAVGRIKDIVARMTQITRVERLRGDDERLPPVLDIRRSSEPA